MSQEQDSMQRYVYLDADNKLAGVYDMPVDFPMAESIQTAQRHGDSLMTVEEYERQFPDEVKLRHIGGQVILEMLAPQE